MSIVVTPIPRLIDLAAPAFTLGTANAAGSAETAVASDSTLLAFDATVPTTIAFGATAAVGSATVSARRDHLHGSMTEPTHTEAASVVQMVDHSSTTTFVSPGRTQNHPGVVKAWVKITGGDGGTEKSYNTESTTRSGTGTYIWTILTDLSATDYLAMSNCEGNADRTATSSIISTTVIHVFTRFAGTLADLSSHNLSLGEQ